MAPCNHISLLQVVKGEQVSLVNNERMGKLVNEMAWNGSSTVQRPSLQFFVGGEAKNLAIRQIFPQNNIGRGYRDRNSIASLRLDTSTSNSNTPVLFGESNPLVASGLSGFPNHGIAQCHQTTCQPCCWTSTQSLYDILHARLLFLFADVICIFADDLGRFFPSFLLVQLLCISIYLASSSNIDPQNKFTFENAQLSTTTLRIYQRLYKGKAWRAARRC